MREESLLSVLAASFLAGEPALEALIARGSQTFGRPWRWLRPVAHRYLRTFDGKTRPRHRHLVDFLRRDRTVIWALAKYRNEFTIEHWLNPPQLMCPVPAASDWGIPAIATAGDLADWLWLAPEELEWFADLKALLAKSNDTRLNHYHYRILAKRSGGVRVIEAPKVRLKALQRQILEWILNRIPPHSAVHGFVKGRSIQSFAAPHVGKKVLLRMDLQDFFPSFTGPRVQAFFRTAGYPESVADRLGGICTNAIPHNVLTGRHLYARPHLPQGAPTSPALANICSYRMDCRLTGLAQSTDAVYTRYADDLAFSGGDAFAKSTERFSKHVAAILAEEGFAVNHRKTQIMRQSVRQHLAGLVTNTRLNVKRSDFDLLKATLTNCLRLGAATQNREGHSTFRSHLQGRVAFLESVNPAKAARLRALFQQIAWE